MQRLRLTPYKRSSTMRLLLLCLSLGLWSGCATTPVFRPMPGVQIDPPAPAAMAPRDPVALWETMILQHQQRKSSPTTGQ